MGGRGVVVLVVVGFVKRGGGVVVVVVVVDRLSESAGTWEHRSEAKRIL